MPIALDATYSLGRNLSGVGVYCRELLTGLSASHPDIQFQFCYRPHRYMRSLKERLPPNCSRSLLHDRFWVPTRSELFHALNQRMPERPLRRSVVTFHDLFVFTSEYSTADFRARFQAFSREAAARADLIISVSQFTADQIVDLLKVDASRVRVIHHGVHPAAAGNQPREKVVLHVGALQARKNIGRLVAAFERMPQDWRLVLAGSTGFAAAEILERIHLSPAQSRIHQSGYASHDELRDWYSIASIFAFPSLGEGFGMPVLEAMSAGVPVVCSNASALPEVAGGAALLVDPSDTEELSTALNRLAEDEKLRAGLVQKGRERAAALTWDKAVAQTFALYKELLG